MNGISKKRYWGDFLIDKEDGGISLRLLYHIIFNRASFVNVEGPFPGGSSDQIQLFS